MMVYTSFCRGKNVTTFELLFMACTSACNDRAALYDFPKHPALSRGSGQLYFSVFMLLLFVLLFCNNLFNSLKCPQNRIKINHGLHLIWSARKKRDCVELLFTAYCWISFDHFTPKYQIASSLTWLPFLMTILFTACSYV